MKILPKRSSSSHMLLMLACLALAGCAVPLVQQVSAPEPQPLAAGTASVTLKLSRVIIDVPKGTVVGERRVGPECRGEQPLRWPSDEVVYNEGEYHTTFDAVLNQYNFRIGRGGRQTGLFDVPVTTGGELLVGARITNLKQNECFSEGYFSLGPRARKGSARFSVHWEVYSPRDQKVILAFDNEGSGTLSDFKAEGEPGYMAQAFGAALKGLLRQESFRKLVTAPATK